MPINSHNTPNQNFELAILLSVVERSGNYVFDNPIPSEDQNIICTLLKEKWLWNISLVYIYWYTFFKVLIIFIFLKLKKLKHFKYILFI